MYARIQNNQVIEYPYSIQKLKRDNPAVSFPSNLHESPELLSLWGVVQVQPSTYPAREAGKRFVEGTPVKVGGVWFQTWNQEALGPEEVATKKAEMIQAIKNLRDYKSQNDGYTVNGKWYHSDMASRVQQLGLVMMGANVPAGLSWKTLDGSFVAMTPALAGQIFAAAAAKDQALFAYAETLIAQVNASNDLESIDIHVGWPVGYGDA